MRVFAERQPTPQMCCVHFTAFKTKPYTNCGIYHRSQLAWEGSGWSLHELQTKRIKTRRKRTTYYAARGRQANGMIVVEVHADWSNFTGGILMPSMEIEAYDTEEATAIFRRYLKRWIKIQRHVR